MFVYNTSKITDNFYLLRAPDYCIYLFKGKDLVIAETGVSQVIPDTIENLKNFGLKVEDVKYIIILHSHYDHSGGVTALKEFIPNAEILGSKETKKILKDAAQIQAIKKGLEKTSMTEPYKSLVEKGAKVIIEETDVREINDEEELDIGNGMKIKLLETFGHSPCAISLYEKRNEILLISDNCGSIFPVGRRNENSIKLEKNGKESFGLRVWPTFFYNYEMYLKNFERLVLLPVKYLGFGHGGVLTEEKIIKQFFDFSKKETLRMRNIVEEKMKEFKNEEEVIKYLAENEFKELLVFFPFFVFRWGTREMIRNMKII